MKVRRGNGPGDVQISFGRAESGDQVADSELRNIGTNDERMSVIPYRRVCRGLGVSKASLFAVSTALRQMGGIGGGERER